MDKRKRPKTKDTKIIIKRRFTFFCLFGFRSGPSKILSHARFLMGAKKNVQSCPSKRNRTCVFFGRAQRACRALLDFWRCGLTTSYNHDSRYSHSHHAVHTPSIVTSSEPYRSQHPLQLIRRRVLLLLLSTPQE